MRRQRLYDGQLFVYKATPNSAALCAFARQLIEQAFDGLDPRTAQFHMEVERYVDIVAPLKPQFIHHPESKRLIQGILADLRCDLEKTYLDVPRLRMVTSNAYLTSGVGYAHHAHRDTHGTPPRFLKLIGGCLFTRSKRNARWLFIHITGIEKFGTAHTHSTTTTGTRKAVQTPRSTSSPTLASNPRQRKRWNSIPKSVSSVDRET